MEEIKNYNAYANMRLTMQIHFYILIVNKLG